MMKKKGIGIIFLCWIFLFSIAHIVIDDEEISTSERRYLKKFPQFTLSGEYAEDMEDYLLDHFPFRDTFRSIKANFNYHVLQKSDNNGISINSNGIFKSDYPTNYKSVENFIVKTDQIKQLLTENNHAYMMLVPDKNYYLDNERFLPIDYDFLYQEIQRLDMPVIDLRDVMELEDYYQTDTHWKQERLQKVVRKLSDSMQFPYQEDINTEHIFDDFYGVLYGQSAVKRKPEPLIYLTNKSIENANVQYLENPKLHTVYNEDKLKSWDAYEVYLDGANAYIEITNDIASTEKELVVFRDSFGSSFVPLLIPYYSKITVIDNRYISSENFLKQIEFKNQDVLFLYSTVMMNNSYSFKG